MNLKKLLALMIALMMALLPLCGVAETTETAEAAEAAETAETAEAAEDDPVVITVGETTYTKSQVNSLVDSYISYMSSSYAQYGQTLDTTNPDLIKSCREYICKYMVEEAVKEQHAYALGVGELTDEEQTEITNEYMNYFYSMASQMGITDSSSLYTYASTIQQYVLQYYGVSYYSMLQQALNQKLIDAATPDVTVTEEQIQAAYETAVETDKAQAGSLPYYYDQYTSQGYTVMWRPEGMRYVKNLLVKFTDVDSAYLSAVYTKASEQSTAAATASAGIATDTDLGDLDQLLTYVTVTVVKDDEATVAAAEEGAKAVPVLTAAMEDTFPATEDEAVKAVYQSVRDYAAAVALKAAYTDLYDQATAEGLAAIDATADAALAELAAGAEWDTVMAKYTEDPGMSEDSYGKTGYLVYEGKSFDPAFLTAALALENVGDYTGKIAGSYGYYIIQYASNVEAGAVPLEEVREIVEADALSEAKDAAFETILAQWVEEANAVTVINYELLD